MNISKLIGIAVLTSTVAVGCAATGDKKADSAQVAEYKAIVKAAKTERKKAKKVGFEWRDIGKFLKKADKAAKKGDYKTAIKLAKKAKFQAKQGQQQAKEQANAGPVSF